MDVFIRQERKEDYIKVYELVRAAFARAEHTNHDEQNLVVRLRNSAVFVPELSLVAETEGKIVGQIMFTRAVVRQGGKEHEMLTLAPLAVAPDYQGKGIGGRLIEAGHQVARELGFKSALLVGHPAYYPRFGYRPAETFGIVTGLELPPDVFMACELSEDGLGGVQGRVEFAPEFNLEPAES
ncbi:MAG: N-acetyltransferase [Bacillota bacterium]|nr:N-acetyltransferase [Bacillota bacterium]